MDKLLPKLLLSISGGKGWTTHLFSSFEEAVAYAKLWLGDFVIENIELGVPVDYSGMGNLLEIKEL